MENRAEFHPLESHPTILKRVVSASTHVPDAQLASPVMQQIAKIRYRALLSNDSVYDEHWLNESSPFAFRIGGNEIIKGVSYGVVTMQRGEQAEFVIPPEHAFGDDPPRGIPLNETVRFEVILEDFYCEERCKIELSPAERIERGEQLKKEAAELLAANVLVEAIQKMKQALDYIDWERGERVLEMRWQLHSNLALAYLRLGKYTSCVHECRRVLEFNKKNVKAMLRATKANRLLRNFTDARMFLEQARSLEPDAPEIKEEQQLIEAGEKLLLKKEQNMYAKILKKEVMVEPQKAFSYKDDSNPKVKLHIKINTLQTFALEIELLRQVAPFSCRKFLMLCEQGKDGAKPLLEGKFFKYLIPSIGLMGGQDLQLSSEQLDSDEADLR